MEQKYEYFAFISYKREDERWAKWLQRKLEYYKLPSSVKQERPELPAQIRPVFRDKSELSGGVLAEVIKKGLDNSKYLIVICSPRAAQSPWVCKEVQEFIDSGREEYIIPFIIGGTPNSHSPEDECFPEGLRKLANTKEILAINIDEMGRNAAIVKVVAHMFNLKFDTLWQRYLRDKRIKNTIKASTTLVLISLLAISLFLSRESYNNKVITYCKTGIMPDDGIFNVQNNLIHYYKQSWLLKDETKATLKSTLYSIDYMYSINRFPIIYSYKADDADIRDLQFNKDETVLAVAGGIGQSGILNLKEGKLRSFKEYVSHVQFFPSTDSTLTSGESIRIHNPKGKIISEDSIKSYDIRVNPQGNNFVCVLDKRLCIYNAHNRKQLVNQEFQVSIISYSYDREGKNIAVSTRDSILSIIDVATGIIVSQRKDTIPIVSLQPGTDNNSFFAAFWGDSTRVAKINKTQSALDTILFSTPSHKLQYTKLSYTKGDYLAFTTGKSFILYNLQTHEHNQSNIDLVYKADMKSLSMSPSGNRLCYAVNGKILVMQIKGTTETQMYPITKYGYPNVIGISASSIFPNDSTIIISVIEKDGIYSTGIYDLYSGKPLSKKFNTQSPVWNLIALPNSQQAALSLIDEDCWAIVDFSKSCIIARLSPESMSSDSPLMLTANGKYLLGIYGQTMDDVYDYRCLWSTTDYKMKGKPYLLEGPLQDGEHLYKKDSVYSLSTGDRLFKSSNYIFSTHGEIFDGDEMAHLWKDRLDLYNISKDEMKHFNLQKDMKGDPQKYKVVSFKHGWTVLFNKHHFMLVEKNTGDVIFQRISNQYEAIVNAALFQQSSKLIVTTNVGFYIIDILDFETLLTRWEKK